MSAPEVVSVLEVAQEVKENDAIAGLSEQCSQEVDMLSNSLPADSASPAGGTPPLNPEQHQHDPLQNPHNPLTRLSQNSVHHQHFSDPLAGVQSATDQSLALGNGQNGKKGRRVFFPTDEKIIAGSTLPPTPWNDISTCSTDDLISAYRKACEIHGVKPLPKLLQQLMAITNFCDRNETLTLRGERLDARHCETIEEILRRVQFRTLDFEACHLEEEGATALFDMIEYYESCIRLNISYNKTIGVRGWQSCARMMKKTPCLEYLEARGCTISDQVMPFVGRSIRLGSQLTTLHLENAIMSGRPLMILVAAIKMNDVLRELFLADNKLMPSDGIQLGNMLKFNHRLQLLDLRNNHLQDNGVSHLSDGLWEQNLGAGLATLVLWNNQVTYQSMHPLSRALMNTKSLETLNLGHNNITNEGVYRLKEGLLNNKSLLRIGLQASKIYDEGGIALAEYIAESPRLVRMDLRENDIKTGGLMALSLSLKVSQSVTRIDLDKDPKKDSAMKDYAEQQRRLLNDISNYMTRNKELQRKREEEEEKMRIELERAQIEEEERQFKEEVERVQQEALRLAQEELHEGLTNEMEAEEVIDKKEESDGDEAEKGDAEGEEREMKSTPIIEDDVTPETAEVVESKPITSAAEETDAANEKKAHSKRQLSLDFRPMIAQGKAQLLESPAFVSAAELPVLTPPPDERLSDLETAAAIAASLQNMPGDFPPSPMMSCDGKLVLAAIPENPSAFPEDMVIASEEAAPQCSPLPAAAAPSSASLTPPQAASPALSPNTRRKFHITRVQETPVPSAAAAREKTRETQGSFQSPDVTSDQQSVVAEQEEVVKNDSTPPGESGRSSNEDNVNVESSVTVGDAELEQNVTDEECISDIPPVASEEVHVEVSPSSGESCDIDNGNIVACDPTPTSSGDTETNVSNESASDNEALANHSRDNNSNSTPPAADSETGQGSSNVSGTDNSQGLDLHSALSMNGMKAELATAVIDSIDKELLDLELDLENIPDKPSKDGQCSSPDDFEKELDAMLANVGGLSVSDPTAESGKSMDEILDEAVGEL